MASFGQFRHDNTSAASQYPDAIIKGEERAATITEKAQAVLRYARMCEDRSGQVLRLVMPPVPPVTVKDKVEPEPDHLVFILEAIEASLRNAVSALDELNSRL